MRLRVRAAVTRDTAMSKTIKRLREENDELRSVIITLQQHIATLERELDDARLTIADLANDTP
jgi:predicted RNase H-like nuclease (RuvC/YqgF family)